MKKLKFVIIPLLLIILVLTGAMCEEESRRSSRRDRGEQEEEEEEEEEENYLSYKSTEWEFELKYPQDWEIEETNQGKNGFIVSFFAPPESKQDADREHVLFLASPPQSGDFDEIVLSIIQDISSDPSANFVRPSEVIISGYPAYRVHYSGYDDYAGNIEYLHYFINSNDIWYQILYIALESTYSKYLPQAEIMIDSFEIK